MQQATVNLFADMGAQAGTLQAGLVQTTASTDFTPPNTVIISPGNGAAVQTGTPITVTGTATDLGGGMVGTVEYSLDGGTTWHRAVGRGTWSFNWLPVTTGVFELRVRAADDSANLETSWAAASVTVVPDSTTAPVISGVAWVADNNQTVTISWLTDESSTSRVLYGTAPGALINSVVDSAMVTSHTITLTSLTPNTNYYFRVESTDEFTNTSGTAVAPFVTPAFVDTTAQDFSAGTLSSLLLSDDGDLILSAAAAAEFSGTVLPTGWFTAPVERGWRPQFRQRTGNGGRRPNWNHTHVRRRPVP